MKIKNSRHKDIIELIKYLVQTFAMIEFQAQQAVTYYNGHINKNRENNKNSKNKDMIKFAKHLVQLFSMMKFKV